MTNQIITLEPAPRRESALQVVDVVPILDTARYEHMQRIATVMGASNLTPETLRGNSPAQTVANCFVVVNQAVRWNLDPFAVMQHVYLVHGRLGYEGKLVHAVLMSKLGIELDATYDGTGDTREIHVFDVNRPSREISGRVGAWKTRGKDGNVKEAWVKDPDGMLWNRGVRTWARRYEPAILLGVYTPEELDDLQEQTRPPRVPAARRVAKVQPETAVSETSEAARSAPQAPAAADQGEAAASVSPAQPETKVEEVERWLREPLKGNPTPETDSIVGNPTESVIGADPETGATETPIGADPELELTALVQQFVEDAEVAQSEQDLADCHAVLEGLQLPRELAGRVEVAYEVNLKRVARPAEEPAEEEPEPAIDPSSQDYQRGLRDRRLGVNKCLNRAIREDVSPGGRFDHWRAGWNAGGEA